MVLLSSSPTNNSINVALSSTIYVDFDLNIDDSSIDNSTITVATNNAKVIETKNILQPNDLFQIDTFFKDGVTGFVDGVVTASGSRLTFTPKRPLQPNTRYMVSVASTVAGENASLLGKIKVFYFTTAEADVNIEELPAPSNLTTIIGSSLIEQTLAPGVFSFLSIFPDCNKIIRTTSTISVEFSEDLDAGSTAEGLKIYVYDPMSDEPVDKLTEDTDYTVVVVDGMMDISFSSGVLVANKILSLRLTSTLRSTSDTITYLSNPQDFMWFISLSPYYSSTRMLRLKAGTILTSMSDADLSYAIWTASMDADSNLANIESSNMDTLKQKYVLYFTLDTLLMNNFSYGLSDFVKKQLGDFNITLSNKHKIQLYNKLLDEIKHWKDVIKEYINLKSSTGYFMRGVNNRSVDIGRLWTAGSGYPGLNSYDQTRERLLKTWDDIVEYNEEG